MTGRSLLVGDIGGTNARFALANPEQPGFDRQKTYRCEDFDTAERAIEQYLDDVGCEQPVAICMAAAGPVVNDAIDLTNNHWQLAASSLREHFGATYVRLLNDFEAIACAVPWLLPTELRPVGGAATIRLGKDRFSVGIIGPGTGLGAAGLRKRGADILPIVGEGGHNGFAPETDLQVQVHAILRRRFERVMDERLVSGPGIENLYAALAELDGAQQRTLTAEQIFDAATNKNDAIATRAVNLFCEVLGQAAGNLALVLGAFDGIYIGGGIVQRYPDLVDNSPFRDGFERKGAYRELMRTVPTNIIMHSNPGLLGAAFCALQLLQQRAI